MGRAKSSSALRSRSFELEADVTGAGLDVTTARAGGTDDSPLGLRFSVCLRTLELCWCHRFGAEVHPCLDSRSQKWFSRPGI